MTHTLKRLTVVIVCGLATPSVGASLLENTSPLRWSGMDGVERLTDGAVALEGDAWNSSKAVTFASNGEVTFDLGRAVVIRALALQGDNNDDYVVSTSLDGAQFSERWRAGPVDGAGLRRRFATGIAINARYLKLTAEGGDGRYSIAELEVFDDVKATGSALRRPVWLPSHPVEVRWSWLAAGVAVILLVAGARANLVLRRAAPVLTLLAFAYVFSKTDFAALETAQLNFLRAVVALMAACAIGRLLLFEHAHPADNVTVNAVLWVTAGLAVFCFLNVGRPQFFDVGKHQPTFLHHYDMRTYFPIARDFQQLRFDGVYAASVAAVAEEAGGLISLGGVQYRDLRTHEMTTVAASTAHIDQVRSRFSQSQWQRARADFRYFREAMGDGAFLGSMQDHGGNATPVWFVGARLLMGGFEASDASLWLGVLVDLALLLLAFVGLWFAYGLRTALVAATLFGACDFYMFGTNWFGAALRHDWLALWALSLAALKRKHFAVGGALLAWSALIRAFPALAFVTLSMPMLASSVSQIRSRTKPFSFALWREGNRQWIQLVSGALLGGGVLLLLSVAMFGFDAWPEWFRKVSLLNGSNHVNNLAVKTWVTTSQSGWLLVVFFVVVAVFAAIRLASLDEAAAFGAVLLPVVFNPANYYLHSVFILAVAGASSGNGQQKPRALLWLILLAMCVGSFFTSQTGDIGTHFREDTFVLLIALGALLFVRMLSNAPRRAVALDA
jgi:hypothetical protein